jgi:D-beta-D-heptose 7-phosphate kinase / D-beta-D-heptose 1-phosphate adenosyltransferase
MADFSDSIAALLGQKFVRSSANYLEGFPLILLWRCSMFPSAIDYDGLENIKVWRSLKILVVGDAILDRYLVGHADRLCREAPAPVVAIEQQQDVPGGAANTAANVASLGGQVTFLSVVGNDAVGYCLETALRQQGVITSPLIFSDRRETLLKQRILANEQILARFDQGSTDAIDRHPELLEQRFIKQLIALFPHHDGIIISDYGYGIITPRVIQVLSDLQSQYSRTLVIDSRRLQAYSKVGATAVKPNYEETCQLLNLPKQSQFRAEQILPYRQQLLQITGAQQVIVTLDREGVISFESHQAPIHTPVRPVPPNQTSGAGDTFVSALMLSLATGSSTTEATSMALAAAAVVIEQPGTTVCSAAALEQIGMYQVDRDKLILDQAQLSKLVQQYRTDDRRIVFTNGCFDILHAGHVSYLTQAKALGDILIVGVNSDESVQRLKGKNRPVNSLPDRLTVLAALSCVDHVVPFTELNPNNLIRIVCPHIYVKGGDYTRETLPEVDLIDELGGVVRILSYVDNRSTTGLINQIRSLQY